MRTKNLILSFTSNVETIIDFSRSPMSEEKIAYKEYRKSLSLNAEYWLVKPLDKSIKQAPKMQGSQLTK
jgi:hypothetical protein